MEQRLKACTFSFYSTMAVIGLYFPLYFQTKGYSHLRLGLLYGAGPLMGIAAVGVSLVCVSSVQERRRGAAGFRFGQIRPFALGRVCRHNRGNDRRLRFRSFRISIRISIAAVFSFASFIGFLVAPGSFTVYWPGEIHRPNCSVEDESRVVKLVVKIHRDLLG